MKVLVACEYSGVVRDAFIARGHNAVSCDLLTTESAGPHYVGDVRDILDLGWDLMIAHPPCTHLACSGARWFKNKVDEQREAIEFVKMLYEAPIDMVAIENPVGVLSTQWKKPNQLIHPWMFGESFSKGTCLWLKGLPLLVPTNIVDRGEFTTYKSGKRLPSWYTNASAKVRSKTFQGIAEAMAHQWG